MREETDPDPFSHISEWVFDLDNTLYPRASGLFAQIDKRMTQFVMALTGFAHDQARALQKDLFRRHGTTLRGLMAEHGTDPRVFLDAVHDIDYSGIAANPALGEAIDLLPGRKHVFTNGDVRHARKTLEAIGIADRFDHIFDIVAADYVPKPDHRPYHQFLDGHDVDPANAAMFEDMPRNLKVPKQLGMVTVLIAPGADPGREGWEHDGAEDDHIDHVADEITGFLTRVLAGTSEGRSGGS